MARSESKQGGAEGHGRAVQQRAARSAEVRRCGTWGHLPLLPCPNVVSRPVPPVVRGRLRPALTAGCAAPRAPTALKNNATLTARLCPVRSVGHKLKMSKHWG